VEAFAFFGGFETIRRDNLRAGAPAPVGARTL
jgi:hypothetical protein